MYRALDALRLSWLRSICHLALAISCVLAFCQMSYSQSTFGTMLGTVKDPSGSVVAMAKVTLMNTGTSAVRTATTNTNGGYEFVNTEIGNYKLSVEAPGFQSTEYQAFDVAARATVRIDIDLKVASQADLGDRGGRGRGSDRCLQHRRDQGQPGVDQSPRRYRNAFLRFHQRLLHIDSPAWRADRQQQ